MHEGTEAEFENPEPYYDFEVAVENGLYLVTAAVGDTFEPSIQKVYFEDTEAGVYETTEAGYAQTEELEILVKDNRLTVRLELVGDKNVAGISTLNFKKISK